MSAFESISQPSAAPVTAVTVNVGRRRSVLGVILAGAVVLGVYAGSYYLGGQAERGRFDAYVQDERVKATAEADRQAAALRDVQAASDLRAEKAQASTTDLQGRIDAYVDQLSHRPVADRCTLTDADLHGLRDLAPGAARPHRRPARHALDAD